MNTYKLGIDIGSTTAKIVLLDNDGAIAFSEYVRHNTKINETLLTLLLNIQNKFGDVQIQPALSGSAAMGIAEDVHIAFIQEIIAATTLANIKYPGIKSLIDIGGEDAKLVLLSNFKKPDIRMNGSCAGGTGAYIDQMATLLNVSIGELNDMAWQSTKIYPIASRCGVFAKTDVQNLISRKINLPDIAASIFEAVANQTINTLARGATIEPNVLFCGGPLTYISYLRESFSRLLKINVENIIIPQHSELYIAWGTAVSVPETQQALSIVELIEKIESQQRVNTDNNCLNALFANEEEFAAWEKNRHIISIPENKVQNGEECFLGIDSGSTTTKIVVTNASGDILYHYYKNSNGKPLETVVDGLKEFVAGLEKENKTIRIKKSAVTGYGEELVKSALGMDFGIVETVAHFIAAQKIEPSVSFILDIGGQDIKAIYVQNNTITNIEINEACSSGCGSFIEGFANTLGYEMGDFTKIATQSKAPYDLGSRCTVFMNSKVKQALRDGATVGDLSAGLAYSVIKNCLNKVLKIKSYSDIGDNIVVQGGTFRNKAVFRSLEVLSGKKIVVSDKPELMGAYGAALYAMSEHHINTSAKNSFVGFDNLDNIKNYSIKHSACKGCTNNCHITVYKFPDGGVCFSGNKCEKHFTNNAAAVTKGINVFDYKRTILFNPPAIDENSKKIRIGIPRILNMYENYPFWATMFTKCNFDVVCSDESTQALYKSGTGSIMSDNICFPAKLAHGHVINLIEKKVNRIFLPFVVYERKQHSKSANSFNCPIVTGYSEVLKGITLLTDPFGIQFDSPSISFDDDKLLRKACWEYLKTFGISKRTFNDAFEAATKAQDDFKMSVQLKNKEILDDALANDKLVVLVASHPYHLDHLIHQQASQILSDLGVNVINEELIPGVDNDGFDTYFSVAQWEYPNRMLQAAWWISKQNYNIGLIQLNSFGCGPDAFIVDEINDLTRRKGISYALVRIDEISSPGSIKLRLRSLVESLKLRSESQNKINAAKSDISKKIATFEKEDKFRTVLVPWFSDFYSPLIPAIGKLTGYNVVNIAPSNQQSIEYGLDYSNNEICYPGTLVVGDIIRTLKSNEYNLDEIAVCISQTGGQCRASNYIAIIKRAVVNAGFAHVPVVSLGSSKAIQNQQPGFAPKWLSILMPTFMSVLFADGLSRMYYTTVCRETHKKTSLKLRDKYLKMAAVLIAAGEHNKLLNLLKEAIRDFNAVQVEDFDVVTVGIVGEIYIKYNSFGQFNVIDWLCENNVEVVVPPLVEFFMQSFINDEVRKEENLMHSSFFAFIDNFLEWRANHHIATYEKALQSFKYYRPSHDLRHSAKLASEILSLNNQYGEGWLIPAEIASFAKQDIQNVICMQPFGCIANHIVGKGMEKKIKNLYPEVNLLFLDFDYGTSKVNVLNRLHFFIQNFKKVEVVS